MRIGINTVDAGRVEGRRTPFDAVHFIAFRQQKASEISAVLPGDASDEGGFTQRVRLSKQKLDRGRPQHVRGGNAPFFQNIAPMSSVRARRVSGGKNKTLCRYAPIRHMGLPAMLALRPDAGHGGDIIRLRIELLAPSAAQPIKAAHP